MHALATALPWRLLSVSFILLVLWDYCFMGFLGAHLPAIGGSTGIIDCHRAGPHAHCSAPCKLSLVCNATRSRWACRVRPSIACPPPGPCAPFGSSHRLSTVAAHSGPCPMWVFDWFHQACWAFDITAAPCIQSGLAATTWRPFSFMTAAESAWRLLLAQELTGGACDVLVLLLQRYCFAWLPRMIAGVLELSGCMLHGIEFALDALGIPIQSVRTSCRPAPFACTC